MPEGNPGGYTGGPLDTRGGLMRKASGGQSGAVRRSLGSSFIESGFATLGGGLAKALDNPAAGAGLARVGQNIADTLRDEWYKQEAENFRSLYGQAYQQELNGIMEGYNQSMTMVPDPMAMEQTKQLGSAETPPPQKPATPGEGKKPAKAPAGPDNMTASEREVTTTASPQRPRMGFVDPMTGTFVPADDVMTSTNYVQRQTQQFFGRLQSATTEFLDAAGQYADNPYISQQAEQVVQTMAQTVAADAEARAKAVEFAERQDQQEVMDMRREEHDLRQERFGLEKRQAEQELEDRERADRVMVEYARTLHPNADDLSPEELQDYAAQVQFEDNLAERTGRLPRYVNEKNMVHYLSTSDAGKDIVQRSSQVALDRLAPQILRRAKEAAKAEEMDWKMLSAEEKEAYVSEAQANMRSLVDYHAMQEAAKTAFTSRQGVSTQEAEKMADDVVKREYPNVWRSLNHKPQKTDKDAYTAAQREALTPIIERETKNRSGSTIRKFTEFADDVLQTRNRTPEELEAAIMFGEDLLKGDAQKNKTAEEQVRTKLAELYGVKTNGQSKSDNYYDFEQNVAGVLQFGPLAMEQDPVFVQETIKMGERILELYPEDKELQRKVKTRLERLKAMTQGETSQSPLRGLFESAAPYPMVSEEEQERREQVFRNRLLR